MKKFLILILLFLLCGCTSEYQLKINGDKIEENVKISINNSEIKEEELAPDMSIKSKESIEYLKTSDLYPVINNKKDVYEKEVTDVDNVTTINLKYLYKNDQFLNSKIINECFEKKNIKIDKGKISIHLSGKFSCLENEYNSLNFKIVTNNKVESANIDYGIFDNEYVWEISNSNKDNVDIQISLLTDSKYQYYGARILGIFLIVIVVGLAIFAYSKISNRKNINKI